MGQRTRTVSIGAIETSKAPDDVLIAYGVGSCVVVCLYDPAAQVGGMLHALLPTAPKGETSSKFVDQGVPLLVERVLAQGARRRRLVARLCGGARVLNGPGFDGAANIGQRNVLAARVALEKAGLSIEAQDTGGRVGRTIKLYMADGRVTLRSVKRREWLLEK